MGKRNTKQEIQNAAKRCFYNYGYKGTSLEMIAVEVGIDKQLITYHFGSKEKLGIEVQNSVTKAMLLSFTDTAADMSVRSSFYANAAFTLWLPRYLHIDENARRFFEDMLTIAEMDINVIREQYIQNTMFTSYWDNKEEIVVPRFPDYIISHQSARWLMHYYCRGDIKMDEDEFESKYFHLNCEPFFSDHKRLEAVYTGAKALLNNLDIRIMPEFEISIRSNNSK